MTSPVTIDLDALLAPIPGDSPAGIDVREDGASSQIYYGIKDARKAARDKEQPRSAGAGGEPEKEDGSVPDARAEWRPVFEQAQSLLCDRSKDLEISAWLIEALVRLHGFAGLRDGLRLARSIVEQYWDGCFPAVDEEGLESRVAPLAGLNGLDREGALIVPILNIPILDGSSDERYGTWRFQQAVALQQMTDVEAREKRIGAGAVTLEQLERASTETAAEFFVTVFEDLNQCIDEYAQLCAALDERCGEEAPPSSNTRNALTACLDAVEKLGKRALEDSGPGLVDGDAVEGEGAQASAADAMPSGGPRDREQAFRTLLMVAAFFRRTEPHSPLSYAIEQVVRWGRLPLPELLQELIDEDTARSKIFRLAGIKHPTDSG